MNPLYHLRLRSRWALGLLLAFLLGSPSLRAQTQIDPSFGPMNIYQPAFVLQALQMAGGERFILSPTLLRAEGVSAMRLVRYSAAGVLDATFTANTAGYTWTPRRLADGGAGRVLVTLNGPATLDGQPYAGLVRLLPSGLVDGTFAPQPASFGGISGLVVQPDGKVVLVGAFSTYGAQPAGRLLRLNADGTLDQTFLTNTAGGLDALGGFPPTMARQPLDGKLLVGGSFRTAAGQPRSALARFNADGTLDAAFAPTTTATALVGALAVQPDGKLLVSTFNAMYLVPGVSKGLVRLTEAGVYDNTFVTPISFHDALPILLAGGATLLVQSDGKVLIAVFGGTLTSGYITRLTPSGATDPTWNVPITGANSDQVYSLQLLPGGQVLFGGMPQLLTPPSGVPSGVGQLTGTGAIDPAFPLPTLQAPGAVRALALQPDGKLLLAGTFTEINGNVARGLARLNANGSLDQAYTAACPVTGGYPTKVVLQPDGKALVGGRFALLGGVTAPSLGRVLPTGAPDPGFVPGLNPNATNNITGLGLQAGGNIVACGSFSPVTGGNATLIRFLPAGTRDGSFLPVVPSFPTALLVQSDDNIVLTYNGRTTSPVQRFLPGGSPDPTFTLLPTPGPGVFSDIRGLWRYPDGRLLVFGSFTDLGGYPANSVARLSATGVPDVSFSSGLTGNNTINAAVMQPNGRILLGASSSITSGSSLFRLLADGSRDLSLDATPNPRGTVFALAVQPDGGLLLGGEYATAGTQPHRSLVRLLDANVLHVSAAQRAARTEAWPVPAHDYLDLRLDAASRPERVELRDALGHLVLAQRVAAADVRLSLATLPVGVYMLTVQYATGAVTRRVVRE